MINCLNGGMWPEPGGRGGPKNGPNRKSDWPARHFRKTATRYSRSGRQPYAEVVLRRAHGSPLLKTFAAKYRASLGGAERNSRFLAALRATGSGFGAYRRAVAATSGLRALGLAGLATLRLVLETLIGEEHLFSAGKNKFGATLRALQNLVMVFHGSVPPETPIGKGTRRTLHEGLAHKKRCAPRNRLGSWGLWANLLLTNFRSLPDRGLNHGAGRQARAR